MKKALALLLTLSLVFALTACGGSSAPAETDSSPAQTAETAQETAPDASSEAETPSEEDVDLPNIKGVEVESGLLDVTITIPSDFAGEITQEDVDASVAENGYKSGVLNDDGSVTYTMSKAKHQELMEKVSDTIDDAMAEMVTSGDYPSFVDIEANKNYTEFTVTTSAEELGLMESMSVLGFYMFGGMYNAFAGETADNYHVQFVNDATGEIIEEANSRDMG